MFTLRTPMNLAPYVAAGAILAAATFYSGPAPATGAQSALSSHSALAFADSEAGLGALDRDVRAASTSFIQGMAAHDPEAVWMFASEEDQAAFGTEQAVYDAFAEVFPALTSVKTVTFERSWQEGDTPFVQASLETEAGVTHRARMGFWLDDAGDWKLVSCDVTEATDRIAGL